MARNDRLIGEQFGYWAVVSYAHYHARDGDFWNCVCGCAKKTARVVRETSLTRGLSKSCGCYRKTKMTRHGRARTPMYKSWVGMIQRCTNPAAPYYEYYGGRGIKGL